MKSSPPDSVTSPANGQSLGTARHEGVLSRARATLAQVAADVRSPLPNSSDWSRGRRFRARLRLLYDRYGWKLLLVVFCYYAIRDLTLYVIIPYWVARKIIVP